MTSGDATGSPMSLEHQHLHTVLRQVDALQRRGETDFESALREINKTSVVSVPGAMYAGITVIDDGSISTLGATHEYPKLLDDAQSDVQEGPCLSAAWQQHTMHINDLAAEQRWPKYCSIALENTSVRTIMSFRLYNEGQKLAALNFYADVAGAFDDESIELGLIYAAHTTTAWNLIRREKQFRSALVSRDAIGQAKGIIMERFGIDAHAAFELLRMLSQEANVKLAEIADRLIKSTLSEQSKK